MAQLIYLVILTALAQVALASKLLIRGGKVVNADRAFFADVLVDGGIIVSVASNIQVPPSTRVIDAEGGLVMPGGIDPHTHLDMPSFGTLACDDFYSGQAAALAGGTTFHIDFALPVEGSLIKGLKEWHRKAADSVMDYGFHMAVTSWSDQISKDMGALTERGINSFKFFMAYKGILQVNDEQLLHGFLRCKELGALPQVHAEHGDTIALAQDRTFLQGITGPEGHAISRPAVLEGEATGRAIKLATWVGVPLYVVHVMSEDALKEVVAARVAGQPVYGETVASALVLTDRGLWDPDFDRAARFVMSPPIRGGDTAARLQAAVAGGLLSAVATDHAVFNSSQKRAGRHDFRAIPNGVNGIEERLHVIWHHLVNQGLMTPSRFVDVVSTSIAQTFGIYPQKGTIAEGSDADIIIFDPKARHVIAAATHHSRIDTNVYEGMQILGKVVLTVSQGNVVWDKGQLNVTRGAGRFVKLPVFPPLFDDMEARDASWLSRAFPYGPTPVDRDGKGGNASSGADQTLFDNDWVLMISSCCAKVQQMAICAFEHARSLLGYLVKRPINLYPS